MKTFTFPGRMGDILMSWPIVYQWYKKTGEKFKIVTCEHWGCPRVLDLLATQQCVADAEIWPHIINDDSCGGQPWHFNKLGMDNIIHMGYRSRPDQQLTKYVLSTFPEKLDEMEALDKPSLFLGNCSNFNYCVFFAKPHQNWLTAIKLMLEASHLFDTIYVIGLPEDLSHIKKNAGNNHWRYIDRDRPNLIADAILIRDARAVITINSLVPTISNLMKIPTVVVHRAQPFEIYSNTGPNQFNYFPAYHGHIDPALEFLKHV